MGSSRGGNKQLSWLFGDPDRPLFSSETLEAVLKFLDLEGRKALLSVSPYLTDSKLGWDDVPSPSDERTLGNILRHVCQVHIDESRGRPVVSFPDLFPSDSLRLDEMPVSSALMGGLKALFPDPKSDLLEVRQIPIRALVSSGVRWREVFELLHLSYWLPLADLSGVGRVSRLDLETWASSYVAQLLYRAGLDVAHTGAFVARFGFVGERITLEEAGERLGVTRERFRQLEKRVKVLAASNPISPPDELEEVSEDPSEFLDLNPDWDGKGLSNLLLLSGVWNEQDHGSLEIRSSQEIAAGSPRVLDLVRKSAGTMGFVNLSKLETDLSEVTGKSGLAIPLLRETYEIRALSSTWALISKGKTSQAETSILNQLVFGAAMTGSEILEGVIRRARSRSVGWEVPPQDKFFELLSSLTSIRPVSEGFALASPAPQEFTGQKKWTVDRLFHSEERSVALEDLVVEGASLGYLPSTTSQYAQTLEYLRVKDNIVWIAALPPSPLQFEKTRSSADLFEANTWLEFDGRLEGGGVGLLFHIGTVFVRSAQVTVPSELEMVVGMASRQLLCICGQAADTPLRVSKSSLKGVTWLRNHLLVEHPASRHRSGEWVVRIELLPEIARVIP